MMRQPTERTSKHLHRGVTNIRTNKTKKLFIDFRKQRHTKHASLMITGGKGGTGEELQVPWGPPLETLLLVVPQRNWAQCPGGEHCSRSGLPFLSVGSSDPVLCCWLCSAASCSVPGLFMLEGLLEGCFDVFFGGVEEKWMWMFSWSLVQGLKDPLFINLQILM